MDRTLFPLPAHTNVAARIAVFTLVPSFDAPPYIHDLLDTFMIHDYLFFIFDQKPLSQTIRQRYSTLFQTRQFSSETEDALVWADAKYPTLSRTTRLSRRSLDFLRLK